MVQSKLKPVIVKISRLRWKYLNEGMAYDEFYNVIGYDMKSLVVADTRASRVFRVRWSDVELVRSEMLPVEDTAKIVQAVAAHVRQSVGEAKKTIVAEIKKKTAK